MPTNPPITALQADRRSESVKYPRNVPVIASRIAGTVGALGLGEGLDEH